MGQRKMAMEKAFMRLTNLCKGDLSEREHLKNVNCSFHPIIAATLSTVNGVGKTDIPLG